MSSLAAWLHNIDPFAIQISGNFGLRWYGLAYLAAFVVGYYFTRRLVAVGHTTLAKTDAMDLVIHVAIGVVFGGRLGYVFFYQPSLLWHFTSDVPFWGVLMLNKGGMASHGGMIGVALAVWFYAQRAARRSAIVGLEKGVILGHLACVKCKYDLHKQAVAGTCPECSTPVRESVEAARIAKHSFLHLFDITAISGATGFFFGRIANFINAELIGRRCSPDLPWAVKFPQEMFNLSDNQLAELAPAMQKIGVDAYVWHKAISDGDRATIDMRLHQLINAIQDGGILGRSIGDAVAPLLTAHHPSQLYAALTEGLIVFVVLTLLWLKPRKPGVIAGWFGLLYGIMRIFNEFYRAPDEHIKDLEYAATGFTRGQWLSAGLSLIGIAIIAFSARRNVPAMGGLRKHGA